MKALIYGTGSFVEKMYFTIVNDFEIIGYCDSTPEKWGTRFKGKKVYAPIELREYLLADDTVLIIVSSAFLEILLSLDSLGIDVEKNVYYYSPANYTLKKFFSKLSMHSNYEYEKLSKRKDIKKILIIQHSEFIENSKTLKLLPHIKQRGIVVDFAYFYSVCIEGLNKDFSALYNKIIKVNDAIDFINYVRQSDYDLLYCVNEPDYMVSLVANCNKPILFDVHDLMSLRSDLNWDQLTHETNAILHSHGILFTSDMLMRYAIDTYRIKNKPVEYIENFPTLDYKPVSYYSKLSAEDGDIHCVYEGIIASNVSSYRYLEPVFMKIATAGVHVHFYSFADNTIYLTELCKKSRFLHYEGNLRSKALIQEITKYDVGLLTLNINIYTEKYANIISPNKLYEYLLARLPVAVNGIENFTALVEKYKCGKALDFTGNIKAQLADISMISIDEDIIENSGSFMEKRVDDLIKLCEQTVSYYSLIK